MNPVLSPLYDADFISLSEVWQVGLEEIHVRRMLKNKFLDGVSPNDCFSLFFNDFSLFNFMWLKSKSEGRTLEIN